MYRYLIIETKDKIKSYESMVIALFSEILTIEEIITNTHEMIFLYHEKAIVSFNEIIINLMQDTLVDFRLYESYHFKHKDDLMLQMTYVLKSIKTIQFNTYNYINDHILVKHFIGQLNQEIKAHIFKKYVDDYVMHETLQTYLENNQSIASASKKLYVHRNTLTQRLDKFFDETGFDVKTFMDGLLIYHLLQVK